VLQDGVITRVGGTDAVSTDVRVICATNRDLEAEVAARRFREDLFYRINILRIVLPPLRERPEDIPLLAQHFLEGLDGKHHLGRKHLTPEVLDAFLGYRWPGNVRELANVLEGIYVTVPDQAIRLEHLPNRIREGAMLHPTGHLHPHAYRDALKRFRREYFRQVMACAGDNVQMAAKLACVNQSTLYRLGGPKAGGR
jgi:transcriptional regulator with PAS, ATPase and Fis domain